MFRQKLATFLVRVFTKQVLWSAEFRNLSPDVQKDTVEDAKRIIDNKVFNAEIDRLIRSAERSIIRNAKIDEEVAALRGGIIYLEALRKRLESLAHRKV
jgi:sigma54-dependent transcription regulator